MPNIFNTHLRQIVLLGLITMLGILLVTTLYSFLPGLLGGITLYILTRKYFIKLTQKHKWNKWMTALLFISICIIVIAIPVYFSIQLIAPKISQLMNNQEAVIKSIEIVSKKVDDFIGQQIFTVADAKLLAKNISAYIPSVINNTANVVSNFFMMFFFLFYLLYSSKEMEQYLSRIIPLSKVDIKELADETNNMIKANALGIPIVSIVHGMIASIGYWIIGVDNWGLWGFLTGVVAFFPIVGIMIVWVPLAIYYYAANQNLIASYLSLYSILITGNVDYITRLGLLKNFSNIHPMITILGLIVGLKLFGFMGLIFGPLLITYFIILVKFYTKEFANYSASKDVRENKSSD